ncbi:MAG: hypothetical protein ACI37Z_09685 [Candidatus Gastranaerophilaceae bacterium]
MNTDYTVQQMLPHGSSMILLDEVIDYDFEKNYLISKVKIHEKMPFFDKKINGINPIIGMEFMAQTIGCFSFLKNNITKPKLGFLLGSRLYNNAIKSFENEKEYYIKVKEIFTDNQICSFDCQIFDNKDEEVACATINAYQPKNIKEILKKYD